jgi:hypothetical protein
MQRVLQVLALFSLLFGTAAFGFAAEEREGMLPAAPFSYEGRVAVIVGQPAPVIVACHPEALIYPVVILPSYHSPAFLAGLVVHAAADLPQGSRWDIHAMAPCEHHASAHDHVHVHLIRR